MMTVSDNVDLTILIPAYNEESVIEETIDNILSAFRQKDYSFDVLIVDNNSTDTTAEILSWLSKEHGEVNWIKSAPRPGYGVAVKSGLECFRGESVVIAMADGSESPEDIANLYQAIRDGADCGFGTRFAGGDRTSGYPPMKLRLNRLGNFVISKLVGRDYDDFTNGFKAYRRWVIDAMKPLKGEEFELTIEMSMKAVLSGAQIKIVENSWRERDAGGSKFDVLRQCARYIPLVFFTIAKSQSDAASLVRFLAVGATSSFIYLLVLSAMVEWAGASATVGAVVAYGVGTIVSYAGSARFAFQRRMTKDNFGRFLAVVGASFILNTTIAYILERSGVHYLIIGLVIIFVVSAFNFFSHRYWTFRPTGIS